VIGGYIPGPHGLDSIIVGYYLDNALSRGFGEAVI
jgi:hypothetical protein